MADIFISLSGRDKAWGDWIAWQLKQAGHNVRYQHWDFQTGENFLLHMEEAGRKAERVLIVVSGNYFASDYTLRELTQAIYRDPAGRKGIIVPVIVEKYDLEGSLLGPLAYVDLTDITDEEAARRSLLAGLEKKGPPLTAPPFPPSLRPADVKPSFPGAGPQQLTSESGAAGASPLGRLHGEVPTLPGGYVERPEALDRLKRAILQSAGAVAVTGKTLRFGVQGMGGIGKTILTATLVRDKEIRRAFPDGIFWLTLGQHPNILAHQAQLARMLGDVATAFADVQEGRGRLNELLADRRALVVLDDVWSVPDAAAFTLRDTYSRLLVTTRMTEVVRGIDAAELELAELPPDQARQLLANFADLAEPDLPPEAEEIIKECGCLPLALAMVGAIAARLPGSWQGLLARLKSANLAKIRAKLPDYPYDDLLRAIQVSLDALDARERTRYIDLAVFPEDVAIPPVVLGVLWAGENLDELGVLELAEAFVARSLARWDARGNLTLHDLQRDVIRATAGDLPGLHRRLLTGYLAQCNDREGWSSGPDDGYFFQHLPWHLAQAGEREQLRQLLFNYRWLYAKLTATSAMEAAADAELLSEDDEASKLSATLRLSAHALAVDLSQLAGQLFGRLIPDDGSKIANLLEAARYQTTSALLPRRPTLMPPGTPLLRAFVGHSRQITAVAALPDGRRALSGAEDRTVRLWDVETGAELRRFEGHSFGVMAVAALPDGRRALSGSWDNTLRLWDLETGAELRRFEGHGDWVTAVAALPDGRHALSGSRDCTIRLWDLATGKELRRFERHASPITAAAVLPDGRHALAASGDDTIWLCDLEIGAVLATFTGDAPFTCCALTLDGRSLIIGDAAGNIHLLDILLEPAPS